MSPGAIAILGSPFNWPVIFMAVAVSGAMGFLGLLVLMPADHNMEGAPHAYLVQVGVYFPLCAGAFRISRTLTNALRTAAPPA
ncbi:hypothetical protein CT690_06200 [Serratia plymuthica]|uniref:Uncharacterized protein n=1 Tax=Serratia plymuthica TaxID=82996 RepID=A0A318P822_SERPL|nr:hypothetical protein CT690_06200 [Serratia plymuthica]